MKTYPIYKPRSGRKAGEAGIKNKSAQADTDTFLFSLLTFIWKIRLSILEKREERRDKREKRKVQKENPPCRRIFFLVEVTGLEPTASTSRTWRSTKLSHTSIYSLAIMHYITSYRGCQVMKGGNFERFLRFFLDLNSLRSYNIISEMYAN